MIDDPKLKGFIGQMLFEQIKIEGVGKQIQGNRDIPDPNKKELLKTVVENILVDYDDKIKVHKLTINFKIPVILNPEGGNKPTEVIVKPPKSGRKPKNQIEPFRDYSTVTDLARFLG